MQRILIPILLAGSAAAGAATGAGSPVARPAKRTCCQNR